MPGAVEHVLGLAVRAGAQLLRLALGLLDALVGPRAGAVGDLVGGLVCALEQFARLLAHLAERVADGGLWRGGDLELGDQPVDLFDVAVDRPSVVAAEPDREVDVAHLFEHPRALGGGDAAAAEPSLRPVGLPGLLSVGLHFALADIRMCHHTSAPFHLFRHACCECH
jgi:hypothetical protein